MSLKAFMAQNVVSTVTEKVVISERFQGEDKKPVPFEIKAISEEDNEELKKACKKRIKQKYGQHTYETDTSLYLAKLVVECTVMPDFKNAELQKSWGVLGAESLVRKMLLPGEYSELLSAVQDICGFEKELQELVEDAKN